MLDVGTDDLAVKPTSHTKVYFNEFVANVLRDNMGMIILTFKIVETVRGQKHLVTHFGTLTQCSDHPSASVLLPKGSITTLSLYTSNSRTKATGLDF